jgi:acyl dehydratase
MMECGYDLEYLMSFGLRTRAFSILNNVNGEFRIFNVEVHYAQGGSKRNRKSQPVVFEYTSKDVILYALGVGASADELAFVYEGVPGGLKVLPSFCVVPAIRAFPYLGEDIEYHIKINGETEDGKRLYSIDWIIFYVGAGGFGGDPGPKTESLKPPEGVEPAFSVSYQVPENQAALYRLSGDLNPLHLDPKAAKRGGFDRPILHGLCTYGFATRAIVNGLLGGDVFRFKEFKARFSDVVYPGEILTTQGWKANEGYIIQVKTDRAVAISHAMVFHT